jgi:hypothetical protein
VSPTRPQHPYPVTHAQARDALAPLVALLGIDMTHVVGLEVNLDYLQVEYVLPSGSRVVTNVDMPPRAIGEMPFGAEA